MRILTTIDTMWLNEVLPASPNWTSQICYEAVASLSQTPSICAVQIRFMCTIAELNGWAAAVYAHIDDDGYDVAE